MRFFVNHFVSWYDRHYKVAITLTTAFFLLQVAHLVWLTLDVVAFKLTGVSIVHPEGTLHMLFVFIDYIEIPSLVSVIATYAHGVAKKGLTAKDIIYFIFINIQWFHIFWITDEFVTSSFNGAGTVLPAWLAWVAIGIDYLEIPIMYDLVKKSAKALWGKPEVFQEKTAV